MKPTKTKEPTKTKVPRIMIAGVSSGSGKTTITCGILQALILRKMKVSAFKCGPDYIDPMFHSTVIGAKASNLDRFFTDKESMKSLFVENSKEDNLSIVEGVMGYFDGISMKSAEGSAYSIAKDLEIPVILVVNCKGMGHSILPSIKGYLDYEKELGENRIAGVLLNYISKPVYEQIKPEIEAKLRIKVLGFVPKTIGIEIKSRHLGLQMPEEIKEIKENLIEFAKLIEDTVNMEEIIHIANSALPISWKKIQIPQIKNKVRIAIARDKAFCFYYKDNLSLLEKMGAELVYFSPIKDKYLPENIDALILGGGYPELYAKELSENTSIKSFIKKELNRDLPFLAECGGFMYLHDTILDEEDKSFPMVGYIKGKVYNNKKLTRFGYIKLDKSKDNVTSPSDKSIKGHEFHYYESTNPGDDYLATKPSGTRQWNCLHSDKRSVMGFPHLYYYSNISWIEDFLKVVEEYKRKRDT